MSTLSEFLFPAPAPRRSMGAILGWWERRRLAYNVWVGGAGLVSLVTVTLYNALSGFAPLVPAAFVVAAIFGTMANICYLLGPATELLIEKLWGRGVLPTGPTLFRMGLTFSVGLALFPTLLTAIVAVVRVVAGLFGIG